MHVLQIHHSKEDKEEDDDDPLYICELLGKVKIRRKILIIKYTREWASFLRREKIAPAPEFSRFTKRMSILLNIALNYQRQNDFGPLLDVLLENDVLIHHSLKLFKGILLFTLHDWTCCNDDDDDQNTNNQEHAQYFQFAILKWILKGLCDVHLKKSANLFTPKEKGDFWDFLFNTTPSTANTLTNSSFFYKVLSCCLERCIILHNSSFILRAIESGIKTIIHNVPTEILDQILTICSDNSEITSKIIFLLSSSPVHPTLQPGPYALEYHLKRIYQTLGSTKTPPQSLLSLPVLQKQLPPHPISKPIAEITKILVELDSFLCSFSSMTEVEPSDSIFTDFHLFFKNIHTCLIDPPEEYLTSIYSLKFFC